MGHSKLPPPIHGPRDFGISLPSQKIKIMFHVFQVMSPDFSRNSSKSLGLYREVARNSSRSLRLYKGPQFIWVGSSEFLQVSGHLSRATDIYDDSDFASLGASLY